MNCSMFQDDCRFCSHEQRIIPFAPLIEQNGRLVPGLVEHRKELIGEMCNNISQWVEGLKYCPARWGLVGRGLSMVGSARADGTGTYSDVFGQGQIPREDEFVICGVGQQRLMV